MTDLKKLLELADRAEGAASLLREAVEAERERQAELDADQNARIILAARQGGKTEMMTDLFKRMIEADAPDPVASLAFEMDDDEADDEAGDDDGGAWAAEQRRHRALELALQHVGGAPAVAIDAARQFEAYLRGAESGSTGASHAAEVSAEPPTEAGIWRAAEQESRDAAMRAHMVQQAGFLRAAVHSHTVTRDDGPAKIRVTDAQVGT